MYLFSIDQIANSQEVHQCKSPIIIEVLKLWLTKNYVINIDVFLVTILGSRKI